MTHELHVGQRVLLSDNRTAIIRFIGSTSFAPGEWAGIAFDEPIGKNDGSVQGKRYFECAGPQHGMFVKPTSILGIVEEPTPRPEPATALKTSLHHRGRADEAEVHPEVFHVPDPATARRYQLNAESPTPAGKRLRNPSTSSRSVSSASNISSVSRPTSPPPRPTITSTRPSYISQVSTSGRSIASTTRSQSRISIASSTKQDEDVEGLPMRTISSRDPLSSMVTASQSGLASGRESRPVSAASNPVSEGDVYAQNQDRAPDTHESLTLAAEARPVRPAPQQANTSMGPPPRRNGDTRKIEQLEAKLRMIEKRRAEDREKLSSLEVLQAEKDRLEVVIRKLQTKYQPQQQELVNLRRQVEAAEIKIDGLATAEAEHESSLEMATLDREVAEETAEALRIELEALKKRSANLDEEVQLLREQNDELEKVDSPEERAGTSWSQKEKENERLKEALLRLRDMSSVKETELRAEITTLQADLKRIGDVSDQYEATKQRLRHTDFAIEELKGQLEAALGAEELVEELTEKNLALNERVQSLSLNLEDLENLKELNDELEQGHLDAEKQFQEELDRRDAAVVDYRRQAVQQESQLADQERLITKLRNLVTGLQQRIQELMELNQLTEAEAAELGQRSRTVDGLKLKLSAALNKAQAIKVEAELWKLDAEEANEHLAVVYPFLPKAYQTDKTSILAYIHLKHTAGQSRLLRRCLKDHLTTDLDTMPIEEVLNAADVIGHSAVLAAICDRLIGYMTSCSVDEFRGYTETFNNIASIMKEIRRHVEAWKINQLRLLSASENFRRHISTLASIAKTMVQPSTRALAISNLSTMFRIQCQLEHASLTLSHVISFIRKKMVSYPSDPQAGANAFMDELEVIFSKLNNLSFVARALVADFTGLYDKGQALSDDTEGIFRLAGKAADALFALALQLGWNVCKNLENDTVDGMLGDVLGQTANGEKFVDDITTHLQTASNYITNLVGLKDQPSSTVILPQYQTPWSLLASQAQASSSTSTTLITEVDTLRTTLSARLDDLNSRNRAIEAQNIKIELLESRMHDATAKAARIEVLEKLLDESAEREVEIQRQLRSQTEELATLTEKRDILEAQAAERDFDIESGGRGGSASLSEVKELRAEINTLHGAVRMLRRANVKSRYSEAELAWLKEPLMKRETRSEKLRDKEQGVNAIFEDFFNIIDSGKLVDFRKTLSKDKLVWRPTNEKTSWVVSAQREDWERWKDRGRRFLNDDTITTTIKM